MNKQNKDINNEIYATITVEQADLINRMGGCYATGFQNGWVNMSGPIVGASIEDGTITLYDKYEGDFREYKAEDVRIMAIALERFQEAFDKYLNK